MTAIRNGPNPSAGRLSALFLSLALLSGCASMRPAETPSAPARRALEAFVLEGRFSLRQDERNDSGRLVWRHAPGGDELLISSPFGQGIAEIAATPGEARLTAADGRVFTAPDVPKLTERALGYRLPLARLADWVRGRAAGAEVAEADAHGRPLRLRSEGWNIEYAYDGDDAAAPPARIVAGRPGEFELRLRIDAWNALPPGERAP